jgi:hypothetical protein
MQPLTLATLFVCLRTLAQNILVVTTGPRWWVKLADFGFSKRAIKSHEMVHTEGGTRPYKAPEMQGVFQNGTYRRAENVTYTEAVDIWAVGIMAFQILAERLPFSPEEIEKYAAGKLHFPIRLLHKVTASDEACDFVRSLMTPQPARRPDAKECLQRYWLQAHTMVPENRGSEVDRPTDELNEASATWESEDAPRVEVEERPSASSGQTTASNTALPNSINSGAAAPVHLESPAIDENPSTVGELGSVAPGRDSKLDRPDTTCVETESVQPKIPRPPEIHPQALNALDAYTGSPKCSLEAERSEPELQDPESEKTDDLKVADVHIHEKKLSNSPEADQDPTRTKVARRPIQADSSKQGSSRSANPVLENTRPTVELKTKDGYAVATHGLRDSSFSQKSTKRGEDFHSDTRPYLPATRRQHLPSQAEMSDGKRSTFPSDHRTSVRDTDSEGSHREHRNGSRKQSSPAKKSMKSKLQHLLHIEQSEDRSPRSPRSARRISAIPRSVDQEMDERSHSGSSRATNANISRAPSAYNDDSRPTSRRMIDPSPQRSAKREHHKGRSVPASSPKPKGLGPGYDKVGGDGMAGSASIRRPREAFEKPAVRRRKNSYSPSRTGRSVSATSTYRMEFEYMPKNGRERKTASFSYTPATNPMPDAAEFRREFREQNEGDWSNELLDRIRMNCLRDDISDSETEDMWLFNEVINIRPARRRRKATRQSR